MNNDNINSMIHLIRLFYDFNSPLWIPRIMKYVNMGEWINKVKPCFSNKTMRIVLVVDFCDRGWYVDPGNGAIKRCKLLGTVDCSRGDSCDYVTCTYRHYSFNICHHTNTCRVPKCNLIHPIMVNVPDINYQKYIAKNYPKDDNLYDMYELFPIQTAIAPIAMEGCGK